MDKIQLARDIRGYISEHISAVWPGFTAVPFILYDDKSQVAVGASWPERYTRIEKDIWIAHGPDSQLMGNTAMVYHGALAAVWDTRTWGDTPPLPRAAAALAHEMFHAFQGDILSLSGANELLLPQYPHTAASVALVMAENRLLADILARPHGDHGGHLTQIAALRRQREALVGADFMEYDAQCESFEGTAAFVEVTMQARSPEETPEEAAALYLPWLTDTALLLKGYRHRCYGAGLALCLACDALWPRWRQAWPQSGLTLFRWISQQLPPHGAAPDPAPEYAQAARALLEAHRAERARAINAFTAQPLVPLAGVVELIGFDPMNLVCLDGRCLHRHGRLRIDGVEALVSTPFLAEYGDHIRDIKKIWVPAVPPAGR